MTAAPLSRLWRLVLPGLGLQSIAQAAPGEFTRASLRRKVAWELEKASDDERVGPCWCSFIISSRPVPTNQRSPTTLIQYYVVQFCSGWLTQSVYSVGTLAYRVPWSRCACARRSMSSVGNLSRYRESECTMYDLTYSRAPTPSPTECYSLHIRNIGMFSQDRR